MRNLLRLPYVVENHGCKPYKRNIFARHLAALGIIPKVGFEHFQV